MARKNPAWLDQAVFYQVYPQSFKDSNGDGIGDIAGLSSKLEYIRDLGCDALWINPWFVSPFQDAGYDVADYYQVAPRYGTNADAKALFAKAKSLGMHICLDLVPGHTSVQHPWFQASAQHKRNRYSDWFVWTNRTWEGAGPGLEKVRGWGERDGAYITNFFYSQPALNFGFARPEKSMPWQLPSTHSGPRAVAAEMLKVMRFWLGLGASGFRVDMAGSLIKNDPGQSATIRLWQRLSGVLRREFPEAVLISEWGLPARALRAGFDLDFMLHFPTPGYSTLFRKGRESYFHPQSRTGAGQFFREYLANLRASRGLGMVSVPSGNHDMDRLGKGRSQKDMKACMAFLCALPGVPFIYYGDEIGMRKVEGLASKEGGYERTGSRTPMAWGKGTNQGFSSARASKLYLPMERYRGAPTVEDQEADESSLLSMVRLMLRLRRIYSALGARGGLRLIHDGSGGKPLAFVREAAGERILVAIHPKARPGRLRLASTGAKVPEVLAAEGARCQRVGRSLELSLAGRSWGLFRL